MTIFRRIQKILTLPLVIIFMMSTLPMAAVNAKMVGTDQVISQSTVSADREKVIQFVERSDVQQQMQSLGVDPDEAKQRVATLSDSEIQKLAGKIDEMPAGEGAVGAVVGAIVLIFVLLLITDILCLTNVYDFTRCAR